VTPSRKRDKDSKSRSACAPRNRGTASTCLAVFAKICIAPESLCLSREERFGLGRRAHLCAGSPSLGRPARAGTRRADRGFLRTTIAVTSRCLTGATSAGANRLRLIPVEPGFFRIADRAHPEAFRLPRSSRCAGSPVPVAHPVCVRYRVVENGVCHPFSTRARAPPMSR
jgi:hypothetical protein